MLAGALPQRAMRLVSEWAERYRDGLLADWELACEGQPLNPVPPSRDLSTQAVTAMPDVLRIADAEPLGGDDLRLTFSTGEVRVVNARPLVERVGGPIFAPLRDPAYFARVSVDPVCGTVVWPNGADLAPTALYELKEVAVVATAG